MEKIRNLRSSNCWKCIQIVTPTTTTLVLYHFKFFTIPSGGPFWLLGGRGGRGWVRTPRNPPPPPHCLRTCVINIFFKLNITNCCERAEQVSSSTNLDKTAVGIPVLCRPDNLYPSKPDFCEIMCDG